MTGPSRKRLNIQMDASRVKRWHIYPIIGEQTVGDHTFRMVQVLRYIAPDCSKELLEAALDHDVPEAITGDIPFQAKQYMPGVTQELGHYEGRIEREYGLVKALGKEEQNLLKVADILEACLFGLHQIRLGNSYGDGILRNCSEALGKMELNELAKSVLAEILHKAGL